MRLHGWRGKPSRTSQVWDCTLRTPRQTAQRMTGVTQTYQRAARLPLLHKAEALDVGGHHERACCLHIAPTQVFEKQHRFAHLSAGDVDKKTTAILVSCITGKSCMTTMLSVEPLETSQGGRHDGVAHSEVRREGRSMTSASACNACRSNPAKVLHRAGAGLRTVRVRSSLCNPRHVDGPATRPLRRTVDGLEKNMPTLQRRERVTS